MRAVTLTEPWASAIAAGLKRVETRKFPSRYRGLLAVHAASRVPAEVLAEVDEPGALRDLVARLLDAPVSRDWPDRLPRGRVVAVAELVSILRAEEARERLSPAEVALGDYADGRYAWMLGGVWRVRDPFLWRGNLGLWTLPDKRLEGQVPAEVFA